MINKSFQKPTPRLKFNRIVIDEDHHSDHETGKENPFFKKVSVKPLNLTAVIQKIHYIEPSWIPQPRELASLIDVGDSQYYLIGGMNYNTVSDISKLTISSSYQDHIRV